ncbi:hypothetical protein R6Q57_011503 [Mikania cordata]
MRNRRLWLRQSGLLEPPARLAEFTLNDDQGLDFYDVSLVDGYNLPRLVIPRDGKSGGCSSTGCLRMRIF